VSDSFEQQSWVQLGVAGALEQEYRKDQTFFLELLRRTLESALPEETEIKTRGFLKKTLAAILVTLDGNRYGFEKPERGPVIATKTKIVRGIALKTEEVAVGEALAELSTALEQRAAKSAEARAALAGMLGLE
jgi:hypothetical protein